MARVRLVTREAVYRGELDLTSPAGQPVRFLDALRTPQRVSRAMIGSTPALVLENGVRESRRGGGSYQFQDSMVLHPATVLLAYEETADVAADEKAVYERRAPARERLRVRIFMAGGLALEMTLHGGSRSLDAIRGDSFIAGTEVRLLPQREGGKTSRLPFLAVQAAAVESYSVLTEDAAADDEPTGASSSGQNSSS